jgi:hypothetical protein
LILENFLSPDYCNWNKYQREVNREPEQPKGCIMFGQRTLIILSFFLTVHLCVNASASDFEQLKKLAATGSSSNDGLGSSVAIFGDYAIAGGNTCFRDETGTINMSEAGAAFIFKKLPSGGWTNIKTLFASDRAVGDKFGSSVSMYGDYAIVSAPYEDEDASGANTLDNSGSVYIFQKNQGGTDNWGLVKKIVASDRGVNDIFGCSIAISGDYVIVGAYTEDEDAAGANTMFNSGSAYIFKKDQGGANNWGQVKKIVASERGATDYFGNSVAISGDYVVVGSFSENEDADNANTMDNAGSAYIFKKDQGGADNWGQVKKIVASDRTVADIFGYSVAISGDNMIISAPGEKHDADGANTLSGSGSAYVFSKNQGGTDAWGQVKKIVASDRRENLGFGMNVSISADYTVIGAPLADFDMFDRGVAYIFKRDQGGADNWGQLNIIAASDIYGGEQFGASVAIWDTCAIVGAPYCDETTLLGGTKLKVGAAYLFMTPSIPDVQASSITFSAVQTTQLTASWIKGNGTGRIVFVKQTSSADTASPVGGATYTANTVFGSGTQIGTSGWYCVYKDTGTSVTITGLSGATSYAVMVCEYNGPATLGYATSSVANNPNTATTAKINQTITFTQPLTKWYGEAPFKLTALASSLLPVSYAISDTSVAGISGDTVYIRKAGNTIITASQAGNNSYNAAVNVSEQLTVSKASQSIEFSIPGSNIKTLLNPPIKLTATASSSLPVSFTNSDSTVARISGDSVYILKTGNVTITASQAGNDNYNAAPNVQSGFQVTKVTQTINASEVISKTILDPPFKLTATATSSLPVSYVSSDTSVAKINGDSVYICGKFGMSTISISQAGDSIYFPAQSINQRLDVLKIPQTITFDTLSNKLVIDDPFKLTATASSSLPITYTSTDTTVARISGDSVYILKAGTSWIQARQAGNATYQTATYVQRMLTIESANITVAPSSTGTINSGDTDVPSTLLLKWTTVPFGRSYRLQITDGTHVLDTTTTDTSFTAHLGYATMYLWKINGINKSSTGPASSWFGFTTADSAPANPPVVLPTAAVHDSSIDVNSSPKLKWQPAARATKYHIQLSVSSDFGGVIVKDTIIPGDSVTLSNLSNDTKHYWRIASLNGNDSSAWDTLIFTTASARPAAPPLVLSTDRVPDSARDVSTSPTLSWQPVENAKWYRVQLALSTDFSGILIKDTLVYRDSLALTGLLTFRDHWWRIAAQNNNGSSAWDTLKFTTAIPGSVFATEPQIQASNTVFGSTGDSSFTVNWTRGNGARVVVFVKADTTGTAFPIDGVIYSANARFGAGSQIINSGWYCVYNGTGTSVTVTGLIPKTTYRVMICEYNGTTNDINYKVVTSTGNPANKTTTGKETQILSFTLGYDSLKVPGSSKFKLHASASSGLPVTFTCSNPSVATISGDSVTITDAGTALITASQAGNENYAPAANVSHTLHVDDVGIPVNYPVCYFPPPVNPPAVIPLPIIDSLPVIVWKKPVSGPDTFHIQISDTSVFDNPKIDTVVADTFIVLHDTLIVNDSICYVHIAQRKDPGGDGPWSPAIKVTIDSLKFKQVITFNLGSDSLKTVSSAPFKLSAQSNSGRPLTFGSSDTTIAKVTSDSVFIRKAGTVTIFAVQPGSERFVSADTTKAQLYISNNTYITVAPEICKQPSHKYPTATPTLKWNKVPTINNYRLIVSTNSSFTPHFIDTVVADTQFTFKDELDHRNVYYWKVATHGNPSDGPFSSVDTFTVVPPVPTTLPSIVHENGYPSNNYPPSLKWNKEALSDSFEIVISRNRSLLPIMVDTIVIDTQISIRDTFHNDETYYWKIRGKNPGGDGPYSPIDSFIVKNAPPAGIPSVIKTDEYPSIGTKSIKWTHITDADSFRVVVSSKPTMDPVLFDTVITDTILYPTAKLKTDSVYYWKVAGKNIYGLGNFSSVDSFRVVRDTIPSTAPSIVHGNDYPSNSYPPSLKWNKDIHSASYEIVLSKERTFSPIMIDTVVVDTQITIRDTFQNDTTYYWKIRSKNSGGDGPFCPIDSFIVKKAPPSGIPSVVKTDDYPSIGTKVIKWTHVSDADSFRVVVSSKSTMDPVLIDTVVTDTVFYPTAKLKTDSVYYWKVAAKNIYEIGRFSSVDSFRVVRDTVPSTVPSIVHGNDYPSNSYPPSLKWNKDIHSASYEIVLSKERTFSPIMIDTIVVDTQITIRDTFQNDTTYYWKIRGKNSGGDGPFCPIDSFIVKKAPPAGIPGIVKTDDDPSTGTRYIKWTRTADADSFRVVVSSKPTMDPLVLDTVLTDTILYQTKQFKNDSIYYWKVAAKNKYDLGRYSSIDSFRVIRTIPGTAPVITSVYPDSIRVGTNVLITWKQSLPYKEYRVQISNDSLFNNNRIDSFIYGSSYKIAGLGADSTWYWKVTAVNVDVNGPWSKVQTLHTVSDNTNTQTISCIVTDTLLQLSDEITIKSSHVDSTDNPIIQLAKIADTIHEQGCAQVSALYTFKGSSNPGTKDSITIVFAIPDTFYDGSAITKDAYPHIRVYELLKNRYNALFGTVVDSAAGTISLQTDHWGIYVLALDTVPPTIVDKTNKTPKAAGSNARIAGMILDNISNCKGTIYYRKGGENRFDSLPVVIQEDGSFTLELSNVILDMNGFEYFVEASDGNSRVSVKRQDIPVKIDQVSDPALFPTMKWHLFAAPLTLSKNGVNDVLKNMGTYGTDWKLFSRSLTSVTDSFMEYGPNFSTFENGNSYWLKTKKQNMHMSIDSGFTTPVSKCFSFTIPPKTWASIGDPYMFEVAWKSIVDSSTGDVSKLIGPYTYEDSTWVPPTDLDHIKPWQGYYVYNSGNSPITLQIPSYRYQPLLAKKATIQFENKLEIVVSSQYGKDCNNYFGFAKGASNDYDPAYDFPKPGLPKSENPVVWFSRNEFANFGNRFQTDFTPANNAGGFWNVKVGALVDGHDYTFHIRGMENLPDSMQCVVVDHHNGSISDMRTGNYNFTAIDGEGTRDLQVFVGSETYVSSYVQNLHLPPRELMLTHVFPNPIRTMATIRYALPWSAKGIPVKIEIFDIRGRLITRLVNKTQMAGYYSVNWNVSQSNSNRIATGVMLLRLKAGKQVKNQVLRIMR